MGYSSVSWMPWKERKRMESMNRVKRAMGETFGRWHEERLAGEVAAMDLLAARVCAWSAMIRSIDDCEVARVAVMRMGWDLESIRRIVCRREERAMRGEVLRLGDWRLLPG